jgi:hypothetical protein
MSAFGAWRQHKAQKKQQEQALASQKAITDQAPQFMEQGRQLGQLGLPLLQSSSNYYRALIGGDRGAIDSALAPERAGIQDTYRGASRGLSMLRGPTTDLATAELGRQKAGQLGLLPAQARANAVQQGQRAGEFATGAGLDARSRGASLYESAAGVGQNQARIDQGNRQQNFDMSSGMGSLFGEVLKGILNRKGGGGGSPLPNTMTPPWSPYPASIYGSGGR